MSTSNFRRAAGAFSLTAILSLPFSAFAAVILPELIGNVKGDSQRIGCDRAAEHLVIDRSSHLDPRCTYTGGVEIVASDVEFDCRGALIDDPEGDDPHGIWVHAPATRRLESVSVRNCRIQGFRDNFRVSRDGVHDLPRGSEYQHTFKRIDLRNSRVLAARGRGVLVDAYVGDVRLRDLEVAHSGGVGIYLEAGSGDNRILRNHIHDNGYGDVDPVDGTPLAIGDVEFRYVSTGREGLAIDGSRNNHVSRNLFENNSYGAIFLYKNCGEYVTERPDQWWSRRFGADGNRIRRNVIVGEPHGVWVGSRMSQNQIFLDCSDPSYVGNQLVRVHEDFAKNNRIQNNTFVDVQVAVRVEDDGTVVERNRIRSDDPDHLAVVIGTEHRTKVLGRPVTGTTVRGNRTEIFLNAAPYVWVHGLGGVIFERNRAAGGSSLLHQVVPPPNNSHLFVKELWLAP